MPHLSRREFLISSLVIGVEAATLHLHPDRIRKPLRVGFIGLGTRGQANLACLAAEPQVSIVAICDTSKAQMTAATRLLSNSQKLASRQFSNPEMLLRSVQTDFVVLSVPPPAQIPIFQFAYATGQHIASETPVLTIPASITENPPNNQCIQLLPHRVLTSRETMPRLLNEGTIQRIEIVHRSDRAVSTDTPPALQDWISEQVGDALDAATSLLELDSWDHCSAFTSPKGDCQLLVLRFSSGSRAATRQLNISITAPLELNGKNQSRFIAQSAKTSIRVDYRQGSFYAQTTNRPPHLTRLYLSNLIQAIGEESPKSLLHSLSTRIVSQRLVNASVDELKRRHS